MSGGLAALGSFGGGRELREERSKGKRGQGRREEGEERGGGPGRAEKDGGSMQKEGGEDRGCREGRRGTAAEGEGETEGDQQQRRDEGRMEMEDLGLREMEATPRASTLALPPPVALSSRSMWPWRSMTVRRKQRGAEDVTQPKEGCPSVSNSQVQALPGQLRGP